MKQILDVCCGSRMFWFNREHPAAVFMDSRSFAKTLCDGRRFEVKPDLLADFIPSVAWEKTAEVISQYTGKGRKIAVEGRIQTRSYDAQDGNKRYVTEVVVNSMEFCESRRDTGSSAGCADEYPGAVVPDSDIPF